MLLSRMGLSHHFTDKTHIQQYALCLNVIDGELVDESVSKASKLVGDACGEGAKSGSQHALGEIWLTCLHSSAAVSGIVHRAQKKRPAQGPRRCRFCDDEEV